MRVIHTENEVAKEGEFKLVLQFYQSLDVIQRLIYRRVCESPFDTSHGQASLQLFKREFISLEVAVKVFQDMVNTHNRLLYPKEIALGMDIPLP